MARSRRTHHRLPDSDTVYNNRLLSQFINRIMLDGKKSVAQRLVYRALVHIKAQDKDPIVVFESAINNVGPRVEVRPRRVGGASYQVPIEVRGSRRTSLAIRWILAAAQKRTNSQYRTFDQKLSAELQDAADNQGEAIRKRDLVHRIAESNRAFAHFRW